MANKYIFWEYNGYVGDSYYLKNQELCLAIPNSTSTFKSFSWLTQKGFGLGYFNNSGVYTRVFKTKLIDPTMTIEQALELLKTKHSSNICFIDDIKDYQERVKYLVKHERYMRLLNPY